MDLLGTTLNQRFRLDMEIGRGGFGVVYRASDLHLGREVAVKVLFSQLASEDSVQRFLREAQVSSQLQDQHIITTFDFGIYEGGVIYIVTELLKGLPLDALFAKMKISLAQICNIMAQVAQGLASAHHLGVIHRDIKPANLFIEWRNQPLAKVIDFGIAKALQTTQEGDEDLLQTKTKALFGTPHYMSPEQVRSTKNVGFASDVYSLGVVFYELVMGELPFNDEEAIQIMIKHLQEPLPTLPSEAPARHTGIDTALWQRVTALIQAMLKKTEAKRLSDWSVIIREFNDLRDALKYKQPEAYQFELAQIESLILGKAISYSNKSNSLSLPKLDTNAGILSSKSTSAGAPRISSAISSPEQAQALGDTLDSSESLQAPIIEHESANLNVADQTLDWEHSSSNEPEFPVTNSQPSQPSQPSQRPVSSSTDQTLGTIVHALTPIQQEPIALSKETITPIPDELKQSGQEIAIVASQMQADFAPKQGFDDIVSNPEARPYPTMFPEGFADDEESVTPSTSNKQPVGNALIFVFVGVALMGGLWFFLGQAEQTQQKQPQKAAIQNAPAKDLAVIQDTALVNEQLVAKAPKNLAKAEQSEQLQLEKTQKQKVPTQKTQEQSKTEAKEVLAVPSKVRVFFKSQSSYSVGEALRISTKVWDQNNQKLKAPIKYQVKYQVTPKKVARVKGNKLYIKAKGHAKIRACVQSEALQEPKCSPYKKIYAIDPF